MSKLFRPHIPIEVRCRVVLRQMGELWPGEVIGGTRGSLAVLLEDQLERLAALLGCTRKDLRLDHDPALGARPRTGEGKETVYSPAANDHEFMLYRTAHGHHLKTNVRGDGAQYPDRVLIKRERKRRKREADPGVTARPGANALSRMSKQSERGEGPAKVAPLKRKWASRPLRSAGRWPKRKFK